MAIARVVYPTMIIHGEVREVKNSSGTNERGPWRRRQLVIEQLSGAQFTITAFDRDGEFPFGEIAVGEFFAANVVVRENAREVELEFHSWPFDDLDRIYGQLSKKKAA